VATTLLHLANHRSNNIGNAALILGLERVLREDWPGEVRFDREPWDEYSRGLRSFDERFVERVNSGCDALLVGGAVTFEGRERYAATGSRFDLPLELWQRIEKPIVFYGVSQRTWPYRRYHHVGALRRMLEHVVSSDRVLFAARNDGTKQWLEGVLGRPSERILEAPDSALYVPVRDAWHPELAIGKVNVIVSLNAEDELYRFGGALREQFWRRLGGTLSEERLRALFLRTRGWTRARGRLLSGLARAFERLAAEHDLQLVLAPHGFGDLPLTNAFLSQLPDELKLRTVTANAGLPTAHGPYFYDLYAKASLAVSMRIHSMNPAIGLGTPTVPLVSQARMREFMADAGLGDLTLDVLDPDVGERAYTAMSRALRDADDVRARLRRAVEALRERTAELDRRVAAFVEAG